MPLCEGPQFLYSFTCWRTTWLLLVFYQFRIQLLYINICVQDFEGTWFFKSIRQIPKSTTVESYDKAMFSFVRNWQTVLQSGCVILHAHQQCERSWYSAPSSAAGIASFLGLSHSNRYMVVSRCCFNLLFPDDLWYEHSFICSFAISVSSLVRCPHLLPAF